MNKPSAEPKGTKKRREPDFIITPRPGMVIVKEITFELESKGGLIIHSGSNLNQNAHELMAISPESKLPYKAGQRLLVNPGAGWPITIKGVQYKVVAEMDVWGEYHTSMLSIKKETSVLHAEKSGLNEEKN